MLKRLIECISKRFKGQQDGAIRKALRLFVNANIWNERKCLVEVQRDLLLSDAAEQVFANLLAQYSNNTKIGGS